MRIIKLLMLALGAVMAFGAIAAASASATVQPLYLTSTGGTLKFKATGGLAALHGEAAGISAEIHCEESSATGEVQNKSMLAVKTLIQFKNKCEQNGGGVSKAGCTEPILVKLVTGEIGLTSNGTIKELVGIVLKPSSGTEFVKVTCGSSVTTVGGEIIGLYPEKSKYNKLETSAEQLFLAKGTQQEPTSIELLGKTDTGVELKVSGFFGGKASQQASATVSPEGGTVEIRTTGK